MDLVRKACNWFWESLNLLMSVAMVAMIILVFTNVVLRYGFNSGILISTEVSRLLFVWVTFLGAIVCLKEGSHLELRLIENFVSPKVVFILRRFVWFVIAVTCAMLVAGAWNQVGMNTFNKLPMSGLPVSVLYLAGVVGGTCMGALALQRLFVPSSEKSVEELN
ncbi:TRAP transporter small permease [Rhodobacteraceae bacterium RKSG542]|uniref:TRAP transporter small permease n=1 Tax=Pseudovibrio flavus TaxID=2529854 RepID=UPI0012BB8DCB|nr:TRAP transporter small permease [Pseudovibrio flavus]MTI16032.1 TRAP transporter small permease [Pseudovibrio flavus]